MKIKDILVGVIIGAIIGIGGTFYAFNGRLSKLEAYSEGKNLKQGIISIQPEEKKKDSPFLFNEDFSSNSKKWLLQDSDKHSVKIRKDKLYVQCKDIEGDDSYGRTSTYSNIGLNKLPPKYTIKIQCKYLSGKENALFGILISDISYKEFYEFNISPHGYSNVRKSDGKNYTTNTDFVIVNNSKEKYNFEIQVTGDQFKFYVNDNYINEGRFEKFSPYDIRLFVSRSQIIEFDNLQIL